jgi:hypothetical protein
MTTLSIFAGHDTHGVGNGEFDQDLPLSRRSWLTVWNGGGVLVDFEPSTGT